MTRIDPGPYRTVDAFGCGAVRSRQKPARAAELCYMQKAKRFAKGLVRSIAIPDCLAKCLIYRYIVPSETMRPHSGCGKMSNYFQEARQRIEAMKPVATERNPAAVQPQPGARKHLRGPVVPGLLIAGLLAASAPGFAQGIAECGSLDNKYGPFDYTNPDHFRNNLPVVEGHHFTPEVESFQGHNECGNNGCRVAGDIDYTLRAFPNHHRALMAMARYHLRGLDQTERRMAHSAECYFDRAIRWAPQDPNVHMIYGYYQNKVGHPDAAIQSYQTALSLAYDNAEAHYNIGLLYADLKDYPNSRKHAKIAYDLGFPLPGLMRKLQRAGEWQAAETRSSPATQAVESSAPKN